MTNYLEDKTPYYDVNDCPIEDTNRPPYTVDDFVPQ